jgi:hypothetical protein
MELLFKRRKPRKLHTESGVRENPGIGAPAWLVKQFNNKATGQRGWGVPAKVKAERLIRLLAMVDSTSIGVLMLLIC